MKRILSFLFLAAMIVCVLSSCGLEVPRPEIKKGEFDFTVTYEINGEVKTVSGIYVCEYNGTAWALDSWYYRDWTAYIKDGEPEELIEIGTGEDGGVIRLYFGFYPEYFMSDPTWSWKGAPQPGLDVVLVDEEGMRILNEADVIEETYGARIISYEYDEPIENSFGLFK